MPKSSPNHTSEGIDLGGFLGGLTNLIEKLGELAETGKELHEVEQLGDAGGIQGVYGFTIRTGLGGERCGGVKVEPFGNVRKDEQTGREVIPGTGADEDGRELRSCMRCGRRTARSAARRSRRCDTAIRTRSERCRMIFTRYYPKRGGCGRT